MEVQFSGGEEEVQQIPHCNKSSSPSSSFSSTSYSIDADEESIRSYVRTCMRTTSPQSIVCHSQSSTSSMKIKTHDNLSAAIEEEEKGEEKEAWSSHTDLQRKQALFHSLLTRTGYRLPGFRGAEPGMTSAKIIERVRADWAANDQTTKSYSKALISDTKCKSFRSLMTNSYCYIDTEIGTEVPYPEYERRYYAFLEKMKRSNNSRSNSPTPEVLVMC